jgi:hypothetical protein
MNKALKITLIVAGSLAVAGGVTFAIVRSVRKRKEQQEAQEKELQEIQQLEEINTGLESQQTTTDNKIAPVRNLDKVLNNSFSQIRGVKLYPAKKSSDPAQGHTYAQGFANIRETPEVNNSQGIYDLWQDNLLGKVSAGASIGTIISEQYDDMTPKMRWFKVKLTKKIDGKQYGWVRGDNVTFVPFTKKGAKSSFDGAFVEQYDNSYQLGADVFPHPNWMVQYRAYAGDEVSSNFGGNLDIEI